MFIWKEIIKNYNMNYLNISKKLSNNKLFFSDYNGDNIYFDEDVIDVEFEESNLSQNERTKTQ